MSSILVYLPPPMQKRALYLMLARAKEMQNDGESVVLTFCAQNQGTCSGNLSGSRLVCAACRISSLRTAKASGVPFVPLGISSTAQESRNPERLRRGDAAEIASGVQSCLVTLLRVMKADLNRVPRLRATKRRYFSSSAFLLRTLQQLLKSRPIKRVEVLNGRFACTKVGIMVAKAFGVAFNTLDFNAYGRPMVFKGHTPHDRIAVQNRIQQNVADMDLASSYYTSRRDRSFNKFAAAHRQFDPPQRAAGYRKKVTFFLSSLDECESLGPDWHSRFRDNAAVIRRAQERFPNYFFCVRFHPNQANIVGDVTEPYRDLPSENLHLFYPDDDVNTYRLMEWSDVVVTFASTVAIEACWAGKPVIELGPSYYDHLSVSYTPENTTEFLELLQTDLKPQSAEAAARFANYEMNDFDRLRYLNHTNGQLKLIGVKRRAGLFAKSAKEFNNLVARKLRRDSRRLLSSSNRSACPRRESL